MGRPHAPGNRGTIKVISGRSTLSAILLVLVVVLITSNRFWRWMYPISYQPIIQRAAAAAQVDPLLVASVIRVESKFRSTEVSHAGAVGLMQLMPSTAQWIAGQMPPASQSTSGLVNVSDPAVNIRLGSWYIHYLLQRFSGNEIAAVAAYNAGPQRVGQWLGNGTWDGRLGSIVTIPVGETRHFVDRVFYNYSLYRRIYGTQLVWSSPDK